MDHFDRERFIAVYRTLAELLERERPADPQENHLSFVVGGLTRRIFVNAGYLPPDEVLEEAAQLRSRNSDQLRSMADRLRAHAQHLADLEHAEGKE